MSKWKKKRTIMRRYDSSAHIYDIRYAEEQTAKYKIALGRLEKRKFGRILDAGCGTGLLLTQVADKSELAIGLDISGKTLLQAKRKTKSHKNVQLVQADSDTMPFKNGIFNHAFAITLLQNSPNPVETLNELRRVSKDDATIVVTNLKKVVSKEDFETMLKSAFLKIVYLINEDNINCYVAVCTKLTH